MDLQFKRVILSKEIQWSTVQDCPTLLVDMMRHRVTIEAEADLSPDEIDIDHWKTMWDNFENQVRDRCNSENLGLYSFDKVIRPKSGTRYLPIDKWGDVDRVPDSVSGTLFIMFEKWEDYARFLKEQAVLVKLAINT